MNGLTWSMTSRGAAGVSLRLELEPRTSRGVNNHLLRSKGMAPLLLSKAAAWGMKEQTAGCLRKTSAFIPTTTERQTTTTWQLVPQVQTPRREHPQPRPRETGTLGKGGLRPLSARSVGGALTPRSPSAVLLSYRLLKNSQLIN